MPESVSAARSGFQLRARGLWRQINLGDRVVRVLDEADIRPVPAMDNRLLDHLLRRALGDQMSLVEQQDAVAHRRRG